jgi:hypothetical protein
MPKFRLEGWTHSEEVADPLAEFVRRMKNTLICPLCKQPYDIDVYAKPPDNFAMNKTLTFEVTIMATCHTIDCPNEEN